MKLTPLSIAGAFLVESELVTDERGGFARLFCAATLGAHGAASQVSQSSLSFNTRRGTVRGLHFQAAPHEEAKTVACLRGAAWDVVVDLRAGSPTRGRYEAVEISAAHRRAVHIPAGCAHGFQTLADATELLYYISAPYDAAAGRGIRWDDPALGIAWPLPVSVISDRDRALPLLADLGG